MPLQKSKGNMYPWVTHTHCHLGGQCSHGCSYCYVDHFPFGRPKKYQGELRLIEKEFDVNYGSGKTIFIENCNDMFAKDVSADFIDRIIKHCRKYPDNEYVFQTKNPRRYFNWQHICPDNSFFGCTIETNHFIIPNITNAPQTVDRMEAMVKLQARKFITIEPIMDFDVDVLSSWINRIRPDFVNIGADSKKHNLPEPTPDKIHALIKNITDYGIEIREKHNLDRLLI